jgi:hypothetical protein
MGIPVPNAWLGGIKNIDLVENLVLERVSGRLFLMALRTLG